MDNVKQKRAPSTKRIEQPLNPIIDVLVIEGSYRTWVTSTDLTPKIVGLKAFGLACVPQEWTSPFFVVSGKRPPDSSSLEYAIHATGIPPGVDLLIRSSGVNESIDQRGNLVSISCAPNQLSIKIQELATKLDEQGKCHPCDINWVIQAEIKSVAKGHLSNERRIAEDKRDWVAETEASYSHVGEYQKIALRPWRDCRIPPVRRLDCPYRETVISRLKEVARWAYERLIRVHFEWVWDGRMVYIVQADPCDEIVGGTLPSEVVCKQSSKNSTLADLKIFRIASSNDYRIYPKLANVKLYCELGYQTGPFYVLDNQQVLQRIFSEKNLPTELIHDLDKLISFRPLVIRTDGNNIPSARRTMLPRSDELRTLELAEQWLLNIFLAKAQENQEDKEPLTCFNLCLIAHHFVPAVASAWCQARPDNRRVRIESLWGIPEGLYWYAYDAFDVDTQILAIKPPQAQPKGMQIREKLRYKENFVAPNKEGNWVVHRTAAGPDWQRSITKEAWIKEIAWTSRNIATKLGKPVVVMWFVDVPEGVSKHKVIPWYHEEWKLEGTLHKAAPRNKNPSSSEYLIQSRQDWEMLKAGFLEQEGQVSRVIVDPREPELLRDPDFSDDLGKLAKDKNFVIQLGGGILSHAYYMLSRAGCAVECVDLDDYATGDEEIRFNKLVRDLIPKSIISRGENVILLRLKGEALISALRRKLVEESLEVLDAKNNEQIIEELADLNEVMRGLMSRLDITEAMVEQARKRKAKQKGTFDDALMLSKTTVAASLSMPELDAGNPLASVPQSIVNTISLAAEIPSPVDDLNIDKRYSASGIEERQFSTTLPAHAEACKPTQIRFDLPTQDGHKHDMVFELQADRDGADLQLRIRVINAPTQLSFDFWVPDNN